MFEEGSAHTVPEGATRPDAAVLQRWLTELSGPVLATGDATTVDEIRALEALKCAAAARQARLTEAFDASQCTAQREAGVREERVGRGVASQVALARRESPTRGQQHLGLAKVLASELPHTAAAFDRGLISEWRATLIARETACLTREHRIAVDAEVAADPRRLERLSDGETVAEVKDAAYRLDPESVVARRRRAEAERTVTLRPAPDTMTYLTALLPVVQGVAVWATLSAVADGLRSRGDERSRGQIMADTLVERVTGQESATAVPVTVNVVISDRALLAGVEETAYVEGGGQVDAELVRELVARAGAVDVDVEVEVELRRLYAAPHTRALVAMESGSRLFPVALARFIRLRDRTCRTPWCDAPVRHLDHVVEHQQGGPTSATNGQGLCQACNHAKQAPGWHALPRPGPGRRHTVATMTPTGHLHRAMAPPATPHHPRETSPGETRLADLVWAA